MANETDPEPVLPPRYEFSSGEDIEPGLIYRVSLSVTCGPSKIIIDEECMLSFQLVGVECDEEPLEAEVIAKLGATFDVPAIKKLLTLLVANTSQEPRRFRATMQVT
jgi:hypothetical protein